MDPSTKQRIPIALQMWSLQEACKQDFAAAVTKAAEIGYEGVEFAGFHGHSAVQVRAMLKENDVVVVGTHTPLTDLMEDKFDRTIDFNMQIGNRNIVVPSLPPSCTADAAAWTRTADMLSELGAKVEARGLRFGYHNHASEFTPIEGRLPWDILFNRLPDSTIMQLDVGHVMRTGADPLTYLKRYPGQARTIHIRENPREAMIGEGGVPFAEVFELCETIGGTEWYIVELDVYPYPPVECVWRALVNLAKMGKTGNVKPIKHPSL
jgi:sugar phosphate isomerase/epimerase